MAVNCCVAPAETDGFAGVTAIDIKAAAVTLTATDALDVPDEAWMVVFPGPVPVTNPAAVIVAIAGLVLLQVTEVNGCWVPLLKFPVAEKRRVFPLATEPPEGLIAIESSLASDADGENAQPASTATLARSNDAPTVRTNGPVVIVVQCVSSFVYPSRPSPPPLFGNSVAM